MVIWTGKCPPQILLFCPRSSKPLIHRAVLTVIIRIYPYPLKRKCHISVIDRTGGIWWHFHFSTWSLWLIEHSSSQIRYIFKQGKSEGFEIFDRPIVRKRPIWVKIGDVLYRVTLKFDGWPWKTIGHLSFAVSRFVQHFIAIGKLKLELQSGNAQFGSNSTIFRAVWPCNLTYDLEKQ